MEVVWGADAYVLDGFLRSSEFFDVSIEAFEFGEEGCIGEIGVNDTDGVVGIEGCQELILGVLNGFKVSGGDVAGGTDECKIHGVGAKVRRSKGAKGQREVSRKGAKTQRKRRKKEFVRFFVETKWVLVLIEVCL